MAVWVVRGGRNGEREQEALEKGVLTISALHRIQQGQEQEALEKGGITIGFDLTEDLSAIRNKEDLRRLLQQNNPGSEAKSISSHASLLWAFKDSIEIGDLIVMPRKGQPTIAVGEMAGEYEYRPEFTRRNHGRAIRWINTEIRRDSLPPDLQSSINGNLTIFQPRNENAEQRLRTIAETGMDGSKGPWDTFIGWAKLFYEWELFDEQERDYKLETGANLAGVKEAFAGRTPEWEDQLKQAMRDPDATNLLDWRTSDAFLTLDQSRQEEGLHRIWGRTAPLPWKNVSGILTRLPRSGREVRGPRSSRSS